MSAFEHATVGGHFSELDTPALCIDLDLMQQNMQFMASFLRTRGKHWRPHAKCHKVPAIAHEQLRHGAIGITVAKVSEAEVFIEAGVPDVLIANMIVGAPKLERVASLCHWGSPIVAVDHYVQAEALAQVCRRRGVTCRIIVEINIGLDRVGVRPGPETRDLLRGVSQLAGVELVGIMGYEGHVCVVPDPLEKQQKVQSALAILETARDQMLRDGLCCDIVSAGGTATYEFASESPAVTELQCGGGIFADPFYQDVCQVTGLRPALRLLSTVVSRPQLERAVLDLGRKSLHPDIHPPTFLATSAGRPLADAQMSKISAEHLTLELGPGAQFLRIGDKIQLIPGYSDHTTPLHTHFFGLRDGYVETVWPIAARGMTN